MRQFFTLIIIYQSLLLCNGLQSPRGVIPSKANLIKKAARTRQKLGLQQIQSGKDLYFPSTYQQHYGPRGFCNWLIPHKVMIGQYPGQTPENHTPQKEEVQIHMEKIVKDGNIGVFCSLQSEVPHQEDDAAWRKANGKIRLPIGGGREDFPGHFTHYAPMAREILSSKSKEENSYSGSEAMFIHAPILDLSTPNSQSLITLLSDILDSLQVEDGRFGSTQAIYIHCWGGRGRAGLVGSCLLSLLFPELNAKTCLEWVQNGYDIRDGSAHMPWGLRRSPQTASQRDFVEEFVREIRNIS